MGLVTSYFTTPGRTDDPDPITGLTSRELYLVRNSYENVKKDPTASGVAMLNLIFTNNPEYLLLFPFGDVTLESLQDNKRYHAHGNSIIYALTAVVDALDRSELLDTLLTKIAESHVPRKVTEKAFMNLKATIIELFSAQFSPAEMVAWNKMLNSTFEIIAVSVRAQLKKAQTTK